MQKTGLLVSTTIVPAGNGNLSALKQGHVKLNMSLVKVYICVSECLKIYFAVEVTENSHIAYH